MPQPARLTVAVLLSVASASATGAADVDLRLEDVGVRRHVGRGAWLPLRFVLHNRSAERFRGSVVAVVERRTGPFPDDEVERQSISRAVELAAGAVAPVCLDLPHLARSAPVAVQVLDASGAAAATLRVDWQDLSIVDGTGHVPVGVLTASAEEAEALYRAILFPPGVPPDSVAPPRLKLLALTSESLPACSEQWNDLGYLVLASPTARLAPEQQRAITHAMLDGLHVMTLGTVLEGAHPSLLVPGPPVALGRGSLQRISGIGDPDAFERLRAAGAIEERTSRHEAEAIEAIVEPEAWLRTRLADPRLPDALPLALGLSAYALAVGPLSFFYLRRRNRRERGWVVMPFWAAGASAVLLAWVASQAFREAEVAVLRCVFSRDGLAEGRHLAYLRLASPHEASYRLRLDGEWRLRPGSAPTGPVPEVHRGAGSLELRGVLMPSWSMIEVAAESVSAAPVPVLWEADAVRNVSTGLFAQAALLVGDEIFETTSLTPGARWAYKEGASRPLGSLVRRRRLSAPTAALVEVVGFDDRDHVRRVMRSVNGVFLGVREEAPRGLLVEPAPDRQRTFTLLVHVFPREAT
jgi:hypothetical protein